MAEEWGVHIGCVACEYFNVGTWNSCDAFPNKIPFPIASGAFDHREKFPNQKNDIVFKKRKQPIKED